MSPQTVTLTLDGRSLQAPAGSYVLQAARRAGIEIPTLCDHPDLEPVGACRLCMVEVTHPDWAGWSGLMTSCLYPVQAGLQVSTHSPRVERARRHVLGLLLARCPSSVDIRRLAERHGATSDGLLLTDGDSCILCGLCARVCEAYATAAITTYSRGSTKAVGPFAGQPPAECVGCGACALICPTGNIAARRDAQTYSIWQRRFDTAVCAVAESLCLGCGSCEEACPFAVARVVVRVGGQRAATIPPEHCRGCGACVGACPSGAIEQQTYGWRALLGEPRGAGECGGEGRGAEGRGAEGRGAEGRGAEGRGAEECGGEGRGAERRGAERRGAEGCGAGGATGRSSAPGGRR